MDRTARSVLVGAGAGVFATIVMSVAMVALQKIGLMRHQPPKMVTDRALEMADLHDETDEETRSAVATVGHLGFGAAIGAVYAPLTEPLLVPRPASGAAFATAVWATSYLGWLPALGLQPPPSQNGRQVVPMLLAHLVYGAVLGAAIDWAAEAWEDAIWERERIERAR